MKDLEERISTLQNDKLALEEAKQKLTSDLIESKEVARLKDQRLEEKDHQLKESVSWVSELEKANAESFEVISKLRAYIKFIE